MDKINNEDNSRRQTIIDRTLQECIEIEQPNIVSQKNNSQSSMLFGLRNLFSNAKNIIKFNLINLNTSLTLSQPDRIHIYSKVMDLKKGDDIKRFHKKISKILYFSYRKNFLPIKSYKTQGLFTSDAGWGCMIRSSQMIFARALYKIFFYENKNINEALNQTLSLFFETPYTVGNIPAIYANYESETVKSKSVDNTQYNIKSIYPPFSIKPICSIGEIYNRAAGEWFSDVNMPNIYKIINENFNVIPKLKIITFQTLLTLQNIVETCFTKVKQGEGNDIITFNGEQYQFKNYGLVFVSVRIGINTIPIEYHQSIKNLFNCKQCIGFIGGKDFSATYFFGYGNDNIFYLDPHYTQEALHDNNNRKGIEDTYLTKKVYQLNFNRLQTAFTIGFLFRNGKEYIELQQWIEKYCKENNPCFQYEIEERKEIDEEKEIKLNMEKDDF